MAAPDRAGLAKHPQGLPDQARAPLAGMAVPAGLLSVHAENSAEIMQAKEISTMAGAHDIGTTGEASAPDAPKATKDTGRDTRQDHGVIVAGS